MLPPLFKGTSCLLYESLRCVIKPEKCVIGQVKKYDRRHLHNRALKPLNLFYFWQVRQELGSNAWYEREGREEVEWRERRVEGRVVIFSSPGSSRAIAKAKGFRKRTRSAVFIRAALLRHKKICAEGRRHLCPRLAHDFQSTFWFITSFSTSALDRYKPPSTQRQKLSERMSNKTDKKKKKRNRFVLVIRTFAPSWRTPSEKPTYQPGISLPPSASRFKHPILFRNSFYTKFK